MSELPYLSSKDPAAILRWAQALVQSLSKSIAQPIPPGIVMPYSGLIAPDGWLICQGQLVKVADQPGLFRSLGYRFNLEDDDEDVMRLPDGRRRTFMGLRLEEQLDEDMDLTDVFADLYGGIDTITLLPENLPDMDLAVTDPGHTHIFSGTAHNHTVTDPQHHHGISGNVAQTSGAVTVGAGAVSVTTAIVSTPTVANAATGISLSSTVAGGTNATKVTGVTVAIQNDAEGQQDIEDVLPMYFSGHWIIKT